MVDSIDKDYLIPVKIPFKGKSLVLSGRARMMVPILHDRIENYGVA